MTTTDTGVASTPARTVTDQSHVHDAGELAPAANPGMVGVPTFLVGAIALGLTSVGYVPATAAASIIAIVLGATGVGQVIAAVWAIREGQAAVAAVFGIFGGFWLSYAMLVMGLTHGWYTSAAGEASAATDAVAAQKVFLLTWLIAVVVLTLASLRLPLAFTVLFALVALSLLLSFLGVQTSSTALGEAGGYAVFAFTLVGVYLFFDAFSVATGGKALPLGNPVVG
ncbi:hypothetical protein GCM10027047_31550 [Rhodococcus aerolatus]